MNLDLIRDHSDDPTLFDFVRMALDYDPASGGLYWVYDWGGAEALQPAGSVGKRRYTNKPKFRIKIDSKEMLVSQLVMFWMTGKWIRNVVHLDDNPFNVAWKNLVVGLPASEIKELRKLENRGVNQGVKAG